MILLGLPEFLNPFSFFFLKDQVAFFLLKQIVVFLKRSVCDYDRVWLLKEQIPSEYRIQLTV